MPISDVSFGHYAIVSLSAFLVAVFGGMTGYGTGLLLPPVLVPIVGPAHVVPIISLSALLTNASRIAAYARDFDARRAALVAAVAFPTTLVGAYAYTRLSGPAISVVLGCLLVVMVPLRRLLARRRWMLGTKGLLAAGSGYGLLTGGTSGAGVVLLSILLSAGLSGPAVIATDAGISLLLGLAKVAVFQSSGSLPASAWIMAAVIGISAFPGAFVARRLTRHLSLAAHASILDVMVMLAGFLLVVQGGRGLQGA